MKSKIIAYFLWFLSICGLLGFHRLYIGKIRTGIFWLISGGCFGIGALIDLFTLARQVTFVNTRYELKLIRTAIAASARNKIV